MSLGASINERERGEKDRDLSQSLHLLFGLNHYPNYLFRLRLDEIDVLEGKLHANMELLRKQKHDIIKQESLRDEFIARTSKIDMRVGSWLSVDMVQAIGDDISIEELIKRPCKAGIRLAIADLLAEDVEGIHSIDLFNAKACMLLCERTKEFYSFTNLKVQTDRDLLAFTSRSPPLYHMGLEWIEKLLLWIVNLILPVTFQEYSDVDIDWCQGYVVGYAPSRRDTSAQRSALINHTDDSEVTINISLTEAYDGGEIVFRGLRGKKNSDEITLLTKPSQGRALFHSGRRLHEVKEVHAGERYNLIFWTRSTKVRSTECPCCWMNNRTANVLEVPDYCICSNNWN